MYQIFLIYYHFIFIKHPNPVYNTTTVYNTFHTFNTFPRKAQMYEQVNQNIHRMRLWRHLYLQTHKLRRLPLHPWQSELVLQLPQVPLVLSRWALMPNISASATKTWTAIPRISFFSQVATVSIINNQFRVNSFF